MNTGLIRKQNASSEEPGAGIAFLQAPAQGPSACRRFTRSRRGQQVAEYGILIAALSAALITMYVYGKRGLSAVIRDTTVSEVGNQLAGSPAIPGLTEETTHSRAFTLSHADSSVDYNRGETRYDFGSWSNSRGETESVTVEILRDDGTTGTPPVNVPGPCNGHMCD